MYLFLKISIMKKLFGFTAASSLLIGLVFWGANVFGNNTTVIDLNEQEPEVPTIKCEGGANECARITSGNTVHIFYKG